MIDKLKACCVAILPTVWQPGMSVWNILCRVIEKLNEVIKSNNQLWEEWLEFQDKFETNLYNTVLQILIEWKEDGTLNDIIGEVFDEFSTKLLTNSRLGEYKVGFIGRTLSTGGYPSGQGMCTRIVETVPYIYQCYYNYAPGEAQRTIIEKMDFQGNVVQRSNPIPLDHSNDICYNKKQNVFVACGYSTPYVYIIDGDTLELLEVKTIPTNIIAITYNFDKDVYYTYISGTIRQWNNDFTVTSIVATYKDFRGVQEIDYWGGMLYLVDNQPNIVTTLYVDGNFELMNVSMIQDFASDYYPVGEVQTISVYNDNGDFVLNGKPRLYNPDTRSYEVGGPITMFAVGNVYHNTSYERRYIQPSVTPFLGNATVNSATTVFKPLGTIASPFTTIGELACCLDAPLYQPLTITLTGDFSGEDMCFINVDNLSLTGDGVVNVRSISLYNCKGRIQNLKTIKQADYSLHLVRSYMFLNGISSTTSTKSQNLFEQGTQVMYNPNSCPVIDSGIYTLMNSVIIQTGVHNIVTGENFTNIGSSTITTSNPDGVNVTTASPLNTFREFIVTIQSVDSPTADMTVASAHVPFAQFSGAGVLVSCAIKLDDPATGYGGIRWVDNTTVNIFGGRGRYRLWAR